MKSVDAQFADAQFADVQFRAALALYDRDDFSAAVEAFERLIRHAPEHIEGRYKLANALREVGRTADAAEQYEQVLERDPCHAEALNNLGAARQACGDSAGAEQCYRAAMALRPALVQPYLNLGRLLQSAGRVADAAAVYANALDHDLDRHVFGHLLSAATGVASARAPESYVRETFDAFASQFDRQLVDALDYRMPERIATLIGQAGEVLDLGCGTGLMGKALGGRMRTLVGVDLSPRMLELARQRGCYEALHEADIERWLATAAASAWDVVVAADVLIYLGRLDAVFASVRRVLRDGGRFVFSVELGDGNGWQLRDSGRYAHAPVYVRELAGAAGLRITHREPVVVRAGVAGDIYVLAAT